MYEIVTTKLADQPHSSYHGGWSVQGVGEPDGNTFATEAEAIDAAERLRALFAEPGVEDETAYGVREIGDDRVTIVYEPAAC